MLTLMETSTRQDPEIPPLSTHLALADHLGALRMRLGFGRDRYRVTPGLYRIGDPDRSAPVLVTANYKLTVDAVRTQLENHSAWLLVLDTRGVNVWCAAGKGTFGTEELIVRLLDSGVQSLVDHRTLVLPQLGAPGVAAHDVRAAVGFRVVYGPVRAADLPAFLDAGLKATPEMRRVQFKVRDRFAVTGVELGVLRDIRVLAGAAALLLVSALGLIPWTGTLLAIAAGATGVVAGGLLVPLTLPWIPGRAFALKGALVGVLAALGLLGAFPADIDAAGSVALVVGVSALASFVAMNFTGSSTFTSLSGVLWEMRRAVPVQVVAALVTLTALIVSIVW
ncbi:MAG: mercury methylation corrinoid protein HgcA [Actinomycetota bacterium]|nr:mercury methylation corrinoid protein HgcA [Actinomycetota bacterium]